MSSSVGIYASQISGHLGLTVDILVVAGGGGGGGAHGGGGGAGGLLGFTSQSLSNGTSNVITIGAGGIATGYGAIHGYSGNKSR